MKGIIAFVLFLMPAAAFAGYGAIAYNPQTQQVAASQGYMDLYTAEQNALSACQSQYPYEACPILRVESNACISLAVGGGRWARGSGYDAFSAQQTALNVCGNGLCTIVRTACY